MIEEATLLHVYDFIQSAAVLKDGIYRMRSFSTEFLVCVQDGRVWLDIPIVGAPIKVDLVRGIPTTGRIGNTIIIPPVFLAPRAVVDAAFDDDDDDDADEDDDDND